MVKNNNSKISKKMTTLDRVRRQGGSCVVGRERTNSISSINSDTRSNS